MGVLSLHPHSPTPTSSPHVAHPHPYQELLHFRDGGVGEATFLDSSSRVVDIGGLVGVGKRGELWISLSKSLPPYTL